MRFLALLLLGSTVALGTSTNLIRISSRTNSCKAYPGTSSWPNADQWTSLNETLGGRLIKPLTPAGVCHKDQPNYDEARCLELGGEQAGGSGPGLWRSYDWHAEDPVSVEWDNWMNWTCLPSPEAPCTGEGYPAYVVNATTAEHVQAGVNFARENNIRLIVKSSGHDFLGRSVAPGSLSIWVHNLNSLTYHQDHFTLTDSSNSHKCPTVIPGDAITAGGGSAMYSLYSLTGEHGTTVVGGGAKSVSVGGYISGGGHSLLSPKFGLAADQVLEVEVVTPMGEILVANEKQNTDLFWALCGGGGSTFGVITSITLKAHPSPKMQTTNFLMGIPNNSTEARAFLGWILQNIPAMMDVGLGGYNYLSPTQAVPYDIPGVPQNLAGMSGNFAMFDREEGALVAEMNKLNETIKEKFGAVGGMLFTIDTKSWDSFLDWFDVNYDQGTCGASVVMKSSLLDANFFTGDSDATVDAIMAATEPYAGITMFTLGGQAVNNAKPRGGSNSVNPGWRTAYVHAYNASPTIPFNRTNEVEVVARLNAAFEPLRELTPGMGAYLNEASPYEDLHVYWGDNYERLLSIKRDVDPEDVFWCSPCVGNERWEQRDDGQLCRI